MSLWLPFALFVLLTVGFVLPCMLDIAITPDWEFTTMSKGMWMMVASVFWVFGAAAWLFLGRPRRMFVPHRRISHFNPGDAVIRHPANRRPGYGSVGWLEGSIQRAFGPDDDSDFLLDLGRRIREAREGL
jgi:hypothetical protein